MASIKDVAKQAGVSPSAVSKYFKTPELMRDSTKKRIAAAVKVLDYYPSHIAKSLRSGRSGVIAIALPSITNPYFTDIFAQFHKLSTKYGFVPVAIETDYGRNLQQDIELLRSGLFDGVLFYNTGETGNLFSAPNLDIPMVYLGPAADSNTRSYVSVDLRAGMLELCAHLTSIGVKRLGYIGNDDESSVHKLDAINVFCAGEALTLDSDFTSMDADSYNKGYKCCEHFIKSGGKLPDAILTSSDMVAVGVYKCLEENGYRVPEDVKLSGYDNTDISKLYSPAITTIHIPVKELCEGAFNMLYSLINSEEPKVSETCFDTKLIVRETT